jgi:uncharacterized protein YjiS (DUF1127 family)
MQDARKLNALPWSKAYPTPSHTAPSRFELGLREAWEMLRLWRQRVRSRAALRDIVGRDARFYEDIGLPRATVYNEAAKWFWQQ